MRHRTYFNGGYNRGGIGEDGGEAIGPVELYRSPEGLREAATKEYVDVTARDLSAFSFTKGIVPLDRFPTFFGDITKGEGSKFITLNPTGVTPGTYSKVTVDANGRITAGTALGITDIPELSWDKVSPNAPTTTVGYGIINALTFNGGVFSGPVLINGVPETRYDVVSKAYVDSNTSSTARSGDIILSVQDTTPPGYLKCNGGVVSIEMFSTLYAVIGDSFNEPTGSSVDTFSLPTKVSSLPNTHYYIKY